MNKARRHLHRSVTGIVVGALMAILLRPAGAVEVMTLRSALALAYTTNPQLEAQRAALRATDETVAKALAGWRPTVTVSDSYGWQLQNVVPGIGHYQGANPQDGAFTITQPVFNGEAIANTDQAKATVDAGRAQLLATEQKVLLAAATAYFAVVRDETIVRLEQDDVSTLRGLLKNAEGRLGLGELTKTDTSQTKARLLGAMIALANAQNQLSASRAEFEHMIGRPAETLEPDPRVPALPKRKEDAFASANAQNPDLAQARFQAKASDYAVNAAIAALYPTVSVQAQYAKNVDELGLGIKEHAASLVGQISIPLYQGGGEEAAVRQAKEERSQAELNIVESDRQVREGVQNAWDSYETANTARELGASQAQANATAYQGAQLEAEAGSRTMLDILNADEELLQSRLGMATSEYNARVAAFQLLAAIGQLTARALRLPTPLYDPKAHYNEDATRWFGLGD